MKNKYSGIFNSSIAHALIIALAGAAVYSNTITSAFVFDDFIYIVDNPVVKDIQNASLESAPFSVREFFGTRYMGFLSFALNYEINGLDVTGYHIFNLIVHVTASLFVYRLIVLMLRTPSMKTSNVNQPQMMALIISLLFAVHPVNTQAVTYISQRFASLCSMFYLASIVFYVQSRLIESRTRFMHYALSLIFAVMAMKTKEIAFTLPIAICMSEFMFFDGNVKSRFKHLSLHLMTLLIIPLSLMFRTSGSAEAAFKMASKGAITSGDYLITQIRVIATYLRLLILPINQNLDYDYPIYKTIADPNVILSILLHAAIIALGVWMFVRSKDKPLLRFASFGIFWFYLTLSVESSVIPIKDVIFEHRVYLPSLGMVTAIVFAGYAAVKDKSTVVKKTALAASVVIILSFAAAAYLRNNVWRTEISLWQDVVAKSPNKARGHNNLAMAYQIAGMLDDALIHYRRALEINPGLVKTYINMADIYMMKTEPSMAISLYEAALGLDPNNAYALQRLNEARAAKNGK